MTTKLKRFTVYVGNEVEKKLEAVKRDKYYMKTKSEMVRDIIALGLQKIEEETRTTQNQHHERR